MASVPKLMQKFKHNPDAGTYGDCWRTCLAMMLGCGDAEEVPHFADGGATLEASFCAANAWFADRHLRLLDMNWSAELEGVLNWHKAMMPGLPYILLGISRNGTNHCVVAIDDAIYCDPSIDQSGIVGPASDGFFWTEYLVYQRGGHV